MIYSKTASSTYLNLSPSPIRDCLKIFYNITEPPLGLVGLRWASSLVEGAERQCPTMMRREIEKIFEM